MPTRPRGHPDDAALITAAIATSGLCAECIAKKTGVTLAHVERVLVRIGKALRIASAWALCDACLTAKKVFRLA